MAPTCLAAGTTQSYLTGPVGRPGTPEALLANPVRMAETTLGNLFTDALIWGTLVSHAVSLQLLAVVLVLTMHGSYSDFKRSRSAAKGAGSGVLEECGVHPCILDCGHNRMPTKR